MVGCNVLKWVDPMIGFDFEKTIVPPSPLPFISPHIQIAFLGYGDLTQSAKYSGSIETAPMGIVKTFYFGPMLQGTGIGKFSPHIPMVPNILLPLIITFSASKSLFTASTVKINGSQTVTAALITFNLNLNCSEPISIPSGVVPAITTVRAGMSLGDFTAGILNMSLNIAFDKFAGDFLGKLFKPFAKIASKLASRLFFKSITENIHVATPLTHALGKMFKTSNSPMISALLGQAVLSETKGALTKEGAEKVGDSISNLTQDKKDLTKIGDDTKVSEDSFGYGNAIDEGTGKFGKWVDNLFSTGPENSF